MACVEAGRASLLRARCKYFGETANVVPLAFRPISAFDALQLRPG
jgi:hypothetical protein